ncbi:CLC6A protein, partial [Galbula dea]|nr:CLC6A protein [Galbula dea]
PASPDSFEDDYDDVSVVESDHDQKPTGKDEDVESQRSKEGTGLYILAGKPPSPKASPKEAGGDVVGQRCQVPPSVAILYVLVALSFVAWGLLFALAIVKHLEMLEELKLLRSNLSQAQGHGRAPATGGGAPRCSPSPTIPSFHPSLLSFLPALICKSFLDDRRCSAGWRIFEKSCYYFSSEKLSWANAQEICLDQGAHLVSIDSDAEQ